MQRKLLTMLVVVSLIGCANVQRQGSASTQGGVPQVKTNQVESGSVLKDLLEPGLGVPRTGGGVELRMNKLASFYPEPSFTESSQMVSNCTLSTKLNLTNDQGQTLLEQSSFDKVMVFGSEVYKKRKVWEENVRINSEVEKTVKNGRAYTLYQNEMQRAGQEQSTVTDRRGRLDSRKLSKKLLGTFGLNQDPKARIMNERTKAYEDLFANIENNKKVLAAQDVELINLEKTYVEQVSQLYFSALDKFKTTPVQQISMDTLRKFSFFREDNIYQCISNRVGLTTPWPNPLIDDLKDYQSTYAQHAQNVITENSASIVKQLNTAKYNDELKGMYTQIFPTKDLRYLVEHNQDVASFFAARSTKLAAEEKAKYEAYLRKQAEEEKRKEKVRLAELKKKIKNNLAPSVEDILPLVIKKSMELTTKEAKLIVEQTSNNSYSAYTELFGNKIYQGNVAIEINNVKCTPSGKSQLCEYKETGTFGDVAFFGTINLPPVVKIHTRSQTFNWSTTGLLSKDLEEASHYAFVSSSSYDDGNDKYDQEPVSYTHLDVYKRQKQHTQVLRKFLEKHRSLLI